jgi:hypothetical protein
MDLQQAIRERHSVRKYTDRPIEPKKAAEGPTRPSSSLCIRSRASG